MQVIFSSLLIFKRLNLSSFKIAIRWMKTRSWNTSSVEQTNWEFTERWRTNSRCVCPDKHSRWFGKVYIPGQWQKNFEEKITVLFNPSQTCNAEETSNLSGEKVQEVLVVSKGLRCSVCTGWLLCSNNLSGWHRMKSNDLNGRLELCSPSKSGNFRHQRQCFRIFWNKVPMMI